MNDLPFVSIIMPVRNEASFIRRSLGAVLAQDYPAGCLEVIAADGQSTDGTREIITQMAGQYPHIPIRVLNNPARIAPTALNVALAAARGEIIVRVDGHCEIAPDYVRRCVAHVQCGDIAGVGGPLATVGETPLAQSIAVAMSSPFGVGNSAFRTLRGKTIAVDTVAFPAYRRAVLDQAGPFDEELVRNQDDEYNYRLLKLGFKILLAADVTAKYYSRSSWRSLWRQYFQYGFWKVRVLQKHPRQMRPRHFVPPLFAAVLLGATLLAPFTRAGKMLLTFIATAYTLANLAAATWTAARRGWRHLPRLPLVYAILHLSYGLGFLAGLVKFWNRW